MIWPDQKSKPRGGLASLGKVFAGAFFFAIASLHAQQEGRPSGEPPGLPLWELSLFNGVARLPHYRGSDEYSLYALPVPYVIYRGDILKIDREGLKGVFWQSDRLETGLSLGGHPPAYKDNKAREGMPELGATAEFGPLLNYYLNDREHPNPLFLAAAVRMTTSVDLDDLGMGYQGLRGELRAVYRNRTWLRKSGVSFTVAAGIDFVDRDYAGYFYDVAPKYATAWRPAHRADGGYAGCHLSLTAQRKISERWSLGVYYRWDNLAGAAYGDSPLVKSENNHTVGFALIWNLFRSAKRVDRIDL